MFLSIFCQLVKMARMIVALDILSNLELTSVVADVNTFISRHTREYGVFQARKERIRFRSFLTIAS
jgi:hypothetical protein